MNCHEVQSLAGPYLDLELDAKDSLALEEHLATCPTCARWLAAERHFTASLTTALRCGEPTPDFWNRTEALVRTAAARKGSEQSTPEPPAERWWQAWLWPSPQFYAGVLALWTLMLAVQFTYLREPLQARTATTPPSPAVQSALAEQRRERAELLGNAGPTGTEPATKVSPISPRSELRQIHDHTDQTAWRSTGPLPV